MVELVGVDTLQQSCQIDAGCDTASWFDELIDVLAVDELWT